MVAWLTSGTAGPTLAIAAVVIALMIAFTLWVLGDDGYGW